MRSMEVKVIKNINEEFRSRWDKFVMDHANGNFYQSPAAYEFFRSVNGYEPVLIAAADENEINGILSVVIIKEPGIKGYFSRRCIVWGGPIYNDIGTAESLIKRLNVEIGEKTIYTEFRNLFDLKDISASLSQLNFNYIDWLNNVVTIVDNETNMKILNESKRRQLKKSIKAGASIEIAKSLDEVAQFYLLLKELYKLKIKKPLPGFAFFKLFLESSHLGKIFIIKYKDKIIGGSICPVFKDKIYEWYVCGVDRKYKDVYPSLLATWAPIQYAAENRLKYFDFMGAGSPTDDYGVREFKTQFGGVEVRYGRYLKINTPLLYKLGKLVLNIKKKLS